MALTDELTGRINTHVRVRQEFYLPATGVVYRGGLYSTDANGRLVAVDDAVAQADKAIVLALESVDNSAGGDDELKADCMVEGTAWLDAGTIVVADRLKDIHATDENTLALTSTNDRVVGRLLDVEAGAAIIVMGGR